MDEVREVSYNSRRKKAALAVFALITVVGIVSVFFYVDYKSTYISTDDAFVEGPVHIISSKVYGTVKAVTAGHNQFVRKGDPLVEIDAADYDVKVEEAGSGVETERGKLSENEAKLEAARRLLSEIKHRVNSARAGVTLQEANLRQAEFDMKRADNLLKKEVVSKERHEKIMTAHDVAVAQVTAAGEQLRQAEASLETQKAVVRQAEVAVKSQGAAVRQREALLKAAELNRGYTRLYAPVDGYVTKKSVEAGNQIQPGMPLMAVVPLDSLWVTANFKETQLRKIRPGQKAEIEVDTYPGKKFTGKVESIMAGTGASFSLFPPENATGNFVKVVQRIPVRITLDRGADEGRLLRVGMSVVPTVVVGE